jgi:hypothetical protein
MKRKKKNEKKKRTSLYFSLERSLGVTRVLSKLVLLAPVMRTASGEWSLPLAYSVGGILK